MSRTSSPSPSPSWACSPPTQWGASACSSVQRSRPRSSGACGQSAGRVGVSQGHWGWGGRCLPKLLVSEPPALARASGQGAGCTGRPLGMDCCSTLTPRDAPIRGELSPGSRPGSWRDGEQRDLGVQATQEALVKGGVGVPGYMPVLQPHQVLPTLLGGFSDKSVSESRVERALIFCWLISRCLQSKERPHGEKAQPVTSLICLTNTCWEPPHPRVPARQRPRAKTEWRPVFCNGGGTCPVLGGAGRVHRLWC